MGLCFALAAGVPLRADEAATEAPTATTADATTLAEWIRKLDDDRFATREAAQQRLLAAGSDAVAGVGKTAAGGSLESSTRAVSILLQWAQSDDNSLSLAALEHLAGLTNRPAEAAMAADRLADVREKAAMEAIVELGGRVEYDAQIGGYPGAKPPVRVVIGPKWTGGNEGLSHIAAVRHATTVSLFSASISGDEAVPQLATVPHLLKIEFYGTDVSKEATTRLGEALPNALIEVRGGARLGISGLASVGGIGAVVNEVQSGTAAEKAGLVTGDVITEIQGTAVKDFNELTREIAKAKAGDTITLKVLRQPPVGGLPALPIDVTVEFTRWGEEQSVNPTAPSPLGGGTPMGMPNRMIINR